MLNTLPNMKKVSEFIDKIINEIEKMISKLSKYSNDKIEVEKNKIYEKIINKCK